MGSSCDHEDTAARQRSGRDPCVALERHCLPKPLSLQQRPFGITAMLKWALFFLIISIIAAIFGFTGIAAAAAGIAKILFFIFIVICVIFLVLGLMAGRAIL
jgi:uncharacterized membrane protein YtjA (UPF0391 family)